MAKTAAKQLATRALMSRIDLSGLGSAEQENFKSWLIKRANMQTAIETALRRGHSMKAYANTYRKQTEYWVQIEDFETDSD